MAGVGMLENGGAFYVLAPCRIAQALPHFTRNTNNRRKMLPKPAKRKQSQVFGANPTAA